MFVVLFGEGIGNQMFQYAFYLSLINKYKNNNVMMDICHIRSIAHNGFELDKVFGVDIKQCKINELMNLSNRVPRGIPHKRFWNIIFGVKKRVWGYKESHIVQDDITVFYPEVYQLNPLRSYCFDGVWANLMYFKDIEDDIRNIFTFPPFTEDYNIQISTKMVNEESVSVHIRGGDYISLGIPVLSMQYYQQAFDLIEKKVNNPVYYIFTNDAKFAKSVLPVGKNYTYITNNSGEKSYRDMQLMGICKHNIIANSSFSFWGAWLNSNKDKIVIAPRSYNNNRNPYADKDWIILQN